MLNRTEEGSIHGWRLDQHAGRQSRTSWRRAGRASLTAPLILVLIAVFFTGCASGGDADTDGDPDIQAGQITRPANSGLPLDNPQAVQAYDRADQFLIDWIFRRTVDAALSHVSSDLHPAIQPLIQDTNVEGECLLTQIEGSQPDAGGVVLARYEISDCEITPPGASAASHIKVGVTLTDQGAWVTGVEFE